MGSHRPSFSPAKILYFGGGVRAALPVPASASHGSGASPCCMQRRIAFLLAFQDGMRHLRHPRRCAVDSRSSSICVGRKVSTLTLQTFNSQQQESTVKYSASGKLCICPSVFRQSFRDNPITLDERNRLREMRGSTPDSGSRMVDWPPGKAYWVLALCRF
jgi:hypothetical protein